MKISAGFNKVRLFSSVARTRPWSALLALRSTRQMRTGDVWTNFAEPGQRRSLADLGLNSLEEVVMLSLIGPTIPLGKLRDWAFTDTLGSKSQAFIKMDKIAIPTGENILPAVKVWVNSCSESFKNLRSTQLSPLSFPVTHSIFPQEFWEPLGLALAENFESVRATDIFALTTVLKGKFQLWSDSAAKLLSTKLNGTLTFRKKFSNWQSFCRMR